MCTVVNVSLKTGTKVVMSLSVRKDPTIMPFTSVFELSLFELSLFELSLFELSLFELSLFVALPLYYNLLVYCF